jgi:hypothetical protein
MTREDNIFEIRIPTENIGEAKDSLGLDGIKFFDKKEQGDETVLEVKNPTPEEIERLKTTERLYSGI